MSMSACPPCPDQGGPPADPFCKTLSLPTADIVAHVLERTWVLLFQVPLEEPEACTVEQQGIISEQAMWCKHPPRSRETPSRLRDVVSRFESRSVSHTDGFAFTDVTDER